MERTCNPTHFSHIPKAAATPTGDQRPPGDSILVVDDDLSTRTTVLRMLAK